MALSQLFISGRKLPSHFIGFQRPIRNFSSSSSSSSTKATKEYMQTHSQVSPKATDEQNEVGGSLYHLKGIFLKFKEKVFSVTQSGKILTGESLDTKKDATNAKASEFIKPSETFHTIELDDPQSRVQPSESMTDPKNHEESIATCHRSDSMSKESSKDSARPSDSPKSEKIVEPVDESQQSKIDPRIFGAPRQGETSTSNPSYCLLNGSVCEAEKAVRDLDVAGSGEKILMEEEQCPTNGKIPTCLVSNMCSQQKEMLSPFSVQMTMSSNHTSLKSKIDKTTVDSTSCEAGKTDERLDAAKVDVLRKTFVQSTEGKSIKTSELVGSTEETSIDYAGTSPAETYNHLASNASCGETSRDDSGKMQVKGLIDVVKNLPKYSLLTKHDDLTISDKIKSFTDGRHPRDKSHTIIKDETLEHVDPAEEKQSLAKIFRYDKLNKQVQHKSQMEGPKRRSESETILQEADNGALNQLDGSSTGVKTPSLDSDNDTVKKVSSEIVDSKTSIKYENGSNSNDAAFDYRKFQASTIPLPSQKGGWKRVPISSLFIETNFPDSDDETIKEVTSEVFDSQTWNEYENGISRGDTAFGKSKASPQFPLSSSKRLKKDAILSPFPEIDLLDSDDNTIKKVPSEIIDSQTRNKYKSGRNSEDADFDYRQSKPSKTIPLPFQKESMTKTLNPLLFTEKGRDQTDILVRFVSINQNIIDIQRVFEDCGPIDEIHFITSNNVKIFKDAYVRFKTKEGRRKALAKIDATSSDSDIVVEAVSPSKYSSIKIHAPNLIGVTGVPTSLVKNPTRTVMVKGLAHNLASHHLEDAFSFCGARITGFFMGSSSSVAYIEFETEDAKEKAIGRCFIPVSGTKLSILRIDAPNTTVVRISNAPLEYSRTRMTRFCSSYGKIKKVVFRSRGVCDIHYNVAEWPVIVDILNSLNGQVVDEHQLIAQPASVIPVEILKHLWSQPDGRRHLSTLIQKLCQNIEKYDMGKVKDLAVQYFEDSIEL